VDDIFRNERLRRIVRLVAFVLETERNISAKEVKSFVSEVR
jgi:hypothetical protein